MGKLEQYLRSKRQERGWKVTELAQRCGWTNLTKGARYINAYEQIGIIRDDLLARVAAVLELNGEELAVLRRQDEVQRQKEREERQREWEEYCRRAEANAPPFTPHIFYRAMPGVCGKSRPAEGVESREALIDWAREFSAKIHSIVWLNLTPQETLCFKEGEPAHVVGSYYTTYKGKKVDLSFE